MTVKRTTHIVAETIATTNPKARASQLIAETLSQVSPHCYASQLVVEVLSLNDDADGGPGGGAAQPVMLLCT